MLLISYIGCLSLVWKLLVTTESSMDTVTTKMTVLSWLLFLAPPVEGCAYFQFLLGIAIDRIGWIDPFDLREQCQHHRRSKTERAINALKKEYISASIKY